MILDRNRTYFLYDVDHRLKHDGHSEINRDGIRSLVEADAFRPEDINVIFLRDSFIFGGRLDYADTVPSQFERMARERYTDPRINVANFAWTSSSPLLSYRLLRDIGARYHPDHVILCIDMKDVHDDIKYQRLLDREGIFKLLGVVPITIWAVEKAIAEVSALDPCTGSCSAFRPTGSSSRRTPFRRLSRISPTFGGTSRGFTGSA